MQGIYVFDHDTGEKFYIADVVHFVEWLNDTSDKYSFSTVGYSDFINYEEK